MKLIGLILPAAALAVVSSFAEVDVSKLPAPAAKKGVTYEADIKPILQDTCFRCHGADRQKGGLRLDSLEAILKGGEDGKVVVPKESSKSPLVIAVSQLDPETAMPPKRGPGGPGGPGGPRNGPPGGGPPPRGPDGKAPSGPRPGGSGPGGFGGPGGGRGPGGPPKPLTTEQVALIRAWIDQGAK